ncbi:MAG: aldolase catalytic domain-containing protein [Thermoguttaceae bacterium]|nr:aldolase catalytic domain-containing protein [Thermoguttaceae bacterium]MDW8039713.1 aldolase catalytic domain-containing protein [Thermoguttaceae bacterium]
MPAPWITYRPEIKVLDCTLRDGGLVNDHHFDDPFVRALYQTCVEAGIDYMEVGYKASKKIFARDKFGAWKFCDEDDLRRVFGENQTPLKLAAMVDAGKADYKTDILPKDKSILDMIRVAFYATQVSEAVDMINDAYQKGYEVSANLMAVSRNTEVEIEQVLELIAQTPASVIVVVDSFGSLYTEQIEMLVKKYLQYAKPTGKEVGIHSHNNLQLAFANTIEAIIHGANRLDASMGGLGRGAGNCPMELLIGFLRNPKFRIRPIWAFVQDYIEPLRRQIEWGPYAQYMMTGMLNQHPRSAIAARSDGQMRDRYVDFYDKITAED